MFSFAFRIWISEPEVMLVLYKSSLSKRFKPLKCENPESVNFTQFLSPISSRFWQVSAKALNMLSVTNLQQFKRIWVKALQHWNINLGKNQRINSSVNMESYKIKRKLTFRKLNSRSCCSFRTNSCPAAADVDTFSWNRLTCRRIFCPNKDLAKDSYTANYHLPMRWSDD